MFEKTLSTLTRVADISGVLVISRDNAALTLARRFGVQTVQESGTPELNAALTRATQAVMAWNAQAVLIAPSDIPFMTTQDIQAMLDLANQPDVIVIAGDRRDDGTNAMLVRPPGLIPYRYGEDSYHKHIAEAQKIGAAVHVFQSPNLALDIDFPDDLESYRSILSQRKQSELAWLGSL